MSTPVKTNNNKPQKPSHAGVVSKGVLNLLKISFISLIAWLLLFLWFVGACVMQGQETTLTHAQNIVVLNTHFLTNTPSFFAAILSPVFYTCQQHLLHWFHALDYLGYAIIDTAMQLFLFTTEINLSRLFIFILALPLFGLLLLVFVTDGLVQRDIRKFQGARESTFIFHRSTHWMQFCFFIPLLVYLSWPFALSPGLFLTAQGILLGLSARLSTASFKKYV